MAQKFPPYRRGTTLWNSEDRMVVFIHRKRSDRKPEAAFYCPCGERALIVDRQAHGIEEKCEMGELINAEKSFGYRETEKHPADWCHFSIKSGVATVHKGSSCPGAAGMVE